MENPAEPIGPQWTILKLLKWTTAYFKSRHIESARASAEILLAHSLNLNRIDLYLYHDKPLLSAELAQYKTLIKRRLNREPVAYILGRKEFWSLEMAVTDAVLIPRPETEILVETVLLHLEKSATGGKAFTPQRILELGTGSGAISIALASERPGHTFLASDLSERALQIAKKNAILHGLEKAIHFFSGDWFNPLKADTAHFDLIVSNPPYIESHAIDNLQPEIKKHEPVWALDGGEDGLFCIKHILEEAPRYLRKGGRICLEIAFDQKAALEEMVLKGGAYEAPDFKKDLAGHDRVVEVVRN